MTQDAVRAKLASFDAPDSEVEQTSFVGMSTPALEPAERVAPELRPQPRRQPLPVPEQPPAVPAAVEPTAPEPVAPERAAAEPYVVAVPAASAWVEPPLHPVRAHAQRVLALLHRHRTPVAAVAAGALAVGGVLLGLHLHAAGVREQDRQLVTGLLEEAGRVQDIVHTYEGGYANELELEHYGFRLPARGFAVEKANRFEYCMTARHGDVQLSLRNGGTVSALPC